MKAITKYFAVLLLLLVALICVGSLNVSALVYNGVPSPTPVPANCTSFAPFYGPVFGVHIVPGAYPVGAYSVNANPNYIYVPHQIHEAF